MVARASGPPCSLDSASRRLLRGGPEGVGEPEPRLLGGERDVLAHLGRDRLDLLETEAQQVCLLGTLARTGDDVVELALDGLEPTVQPGGSPGARPGGSAEPVQRLALRPCPQQPVLVGLAVHGHERFGELGEHRDGHRRTAGEGA